MTQGFDRQRYFDLASYAHAKLFEPGKAVWQSLDELASYISSLELGRVEGTVHEGAILVNPETIYIGPGAVIEPTAYIKGPCWIGANTVVRHAAYLRGGVITGESCVIGHCTEVKNSIFLDRAQAAHFAYVGDSVLGNRVNLGAGTRLANLRLDGKEVVIRDGEQRIATGRRKFGAIVGDDAQLGCNCVCNPGALIERGARVMPCANVGGIVTTEVTRA